MKRNSAVFAILVGGAVAGTLDITYAILFSWFRGTAPMRLLQSVATGLLGRPALEGGVPTAALGLLLHYSIMFSIAAVFYAVTRQMPAATKRPILFGMLGGIVIYLLMNFVVLPLSAYPFAFRVDPIVITANVLVHMFLIGTPISLAARKSRS
jgi:hypothetical protein